MIAALRRRGPAGVSTASPFPTALRVAGNPALLRLGMLAAALDPAVASGAADPAAVAPAGPHVTDDLVETVALALADGDPSVAWLALAVLGPGLPLPEDVEHVAHVARLDGGHAALREVVQRYRLRPLMPGPGVHVTSDVLVDVHHTSRTELATGIQRVAREVSRRWRDEHGARLVGWNERTGSLHALEPDASRGPSLIPWQGTYLLPELAVDDWRTPRLRALARYSRSVTGVVGFDCVPITSSETTAGGFGTAFSLNLAAVRHMTRVAAISEGAAGEYRGWRRMLSGTGLPGPGIRAVTLPGESPDPGEAALARARARFTVGHLPMVLCVGSHEPRKNHLALLHAAELAWRDGHRFTLVFVGGNAWRSEDFFAAVDRLRSHDRPIDTVTALDDDSLHALYRVARCVAFPSLNEGYGLPVAEALAAGTPVLTSGYGSMAEIADDGGALLVDPRDDRSIAEALVRLVTDDHLVARLRAEAAARPPSSWDDYARRTWDYLVRGEGEDS